MSKCSGQHQHRDSQFEHDHGVGTMVAQTDRGGQLHHHCDSKCILNRDDEIERMRELFESCQRDVDHYQDSQKPACNIAWCVTRLIFTINEALKPKDTK